MFEEIYGKAMEILGTAEAQGALLTIALEFVFRLFKSEKPLGLVHSAAKFVRVGADIAQKAASILTKLADLSDKVLPQRTKG
jgi:hypothetical protein